MGCGKQRRFKRRKGILYDYSGDGMYSSERIKGYWKRYWRKWYLRYLKNQSLRELNGREKNYSS